MSIKLEIACPFCGEEKLTWANTTCNKTGKSLSYESLLAYKIMEMEGCSCTAEEKEEVSPFDELEKELDEVVPIPEPEPEIIPEPDLTIEIDVKEAEPTLEDLKAKIVELEAAKSPAEEPEGE